MLEFLSQWSYLGIIVFLILTGCGMPLPEEVAIVLAGVLSAQESMDVWLALGSCLIGAVLGDALIYAIGYHWGHGLLNAHPRFARLLHAEREERFEQIVQAHGLKVLLLARFMVGIRGPIYLATGALRVPFRRFLLMDLFCATLVVSVFFGLSYFFGQAALKWIKSFEIGLTAIVVLVAIVVILIVLYQRRKKRLAQKLFEQATGEELPVDCDDLDDPNAEDRAQDDESDGKGGSEKTVA